MRKQSIGIILLSILVLLLCCGIPVANLMQNYHQQRAKQRAISSNQHTLFCETLEPGMSISEVSDILNKKGNVIIRMADGDSQYTHYSILFTDKEEQDVYGGWLELIFVQGEYNQAYELGFDYTKEYCNFGLTPK